MVTVDADGKVVTKRIIVEEVGSSVDTNSAYLILCGVIVVAVIAVIGIICIVKKCGGKKDARSAAKSVEYQVKGEPIKSDFNDIAEVEGEQQY